MTIRLSGFHILIISMLLTTSTIWAAGPTSQQQQQRPPTGAAVPIPQGQQPQVGIPPTGGTQGVPVVGAIRLNVNQNGTPACPSSANSIVSVLDDMEGNKVKVTHNGKTTTYIPQASAVSGLPLLRFDVQLCGQSNAFTYQADATSNVLKRLLAFHIGGSNGQDVVTLNFATNAAGKYVSMGKAPEMTINLGKV